MRFDKLKGLAVVSIDSAAKLGKIADVLLDLQNNRIAAFDIQTPDGKARTLVSAGQVRNIGADAVTVHDQNVAANDGAARQVQPGEPDLAGTVAFSRLDNTYKIITDSGKLLGVIKDFEFDPATLAITAFETTEGGLFAKHHVVNTNPAINFGENMAVVPEQVMSAPNNQ